MSQDDTTLGHIAHWIENGFTSGYYPYWKLFFSDIQHNELSEATLQHVAGAVSDGFVEGEIVENNGNGWWKIQS